MFLAVNIFWALLRAHFSLWPMAQAKMSLSGAQDIFKQANMDSIVLLMLMRKTDNKGN